MHDLVIRPSVQTLRYADRRTVDVAARIGVSSARVNRIAAEPAMTTLDDALERKDRPPRRRGENGEPIE